MTKRQALYLEASILGFFTAASSVPTPLYAIYQARWGFSPITLTAVFGVYAIAVLASLLVTGSLSDHVGRRPVLLVAIAMQAAAAIVFATAGGLGALFAARIVQGLATGAAGAAVGAGMLDLDQARGTIANAVAPAAGTATGSLLSGLFVQFLPAPTHLVYLVFFGVFVAQAVGVLAMPETASRTAGALASLRPQLRVPPAGRAPLLVAVPALVAAWALCGFYGSLGPTVVHRLAGSRSVALGGLALFALGASGAIAALLLRARSQRFLLTYGTSALVTGVAVTVAAIGRGSVAGFFIGTMIAGTGFVTSFQGAFRSVVAVAATHERAGVVSVIYGISYVAFGIPAVLGGIRLASGGDVLGTAHEYGLGVMALAALALAGTIASGIRVRNHLPSHV
jgi:MFS family permease